MALLLNMCRGDIVNPTHGHHHAEVPVSSESCIVGFLQSRSGLPADEKAISVPLPSTYTKQASIISYHIWVWTAHVRSILSERPDHITLAVLGCFVKSFLGI